MTACITEPRTNKKSRGLHFKPVQVFQMGIPHFPEGFHSLVRPLARTAIQQDHGILIRKQLRRELFQFIHRNIHGTLLVARAVLLRGADVHQHNFMRGTSVWRHHHGGGRGNAFCVPPLQPYENGGQPGHHDHIKNHGFHVSNSLNRNGGINKQTFNSCLSASLTLHHQTPQPGKHNRKRGFPTPPRPPASNTAADSSPCPHPPEFRWKPHPRATGS